MKWVQDLISSHFELLLLGFIFVFATIMLAFFPMRDEMARWIEGGAIISIIASALRKPVSKTSPDDSPDTTMSKVTNTVTNTVEKKEPTP